MLTVGQKFYLFSNCLQALTFADTVATIYFPIFFIGALWQIQSELNDKFKILLDLKIQKITISEFQQQASSSVKLKLRNKFWCCKIILIGSNSWKSVSLTWNWGFNQSKEKNRVKLISLSLSNNIKISLSTPRKPFFERHFWSLSPKCWLSGDCHFIISCFILWLYMSHKINL